MTDNLPFERIRAVIFDFDGTLAVPALDFAVLRERAFAAVAAVIDKSAETMPFAASGLPVMEELDRLCRDLPSHTAGAARAVALAAIKDVEKEAAGRSSLFAFVRPMLAALRERGLDMAVVTRNCPAAVYTVFPDLDEHVACVLTREHVRHVKPHPEHMQSALRLLGRAPEQSLCVGDHPMDIEAGRRVGAYTAAVASGESTADELAANNPDILANDAWQAVQGLLL